MERRLAEFRASQKRAKSGCETGVGANTSMGPLGVQQREDSNWEPHVKEERKEPSRPEAFAALPRVEDGFSPHPLQTGRSRLNKTLLLKFLLWLVLLGLFVELEFGLAYFVLSMFYWLYEGTRGPGEKKEGEKSAYSVFNPGCEPIQGTLTAEQLERELVFRPLLGL